jgi:hypothetical protein
MWFLVTFPPLNAVASRGLSPGGFSRSFPPCNCTSGYVKHCAERRRACPTGRFESWIAWKFFVVGWQGIGFVLFQGPPAWTEKLSIDLSRSHRNWSSNRHSMARGQDRCRGRQQRKAAATTRTAWGNRGTPSQSSRSDPSLAGKERSAVDKGPRTSGVRWSPGSMSISAPLRTEVARLWKTEVGYRPADVCPSRVEISPGDRRTRGRQRIAGRSDAQKPILARQFAACPESPLDFLACRPSFPNFIPASPDRNAYQQKTAPKYRKNAY